MAGVNPYIKKMPVNRPTRPYTVTFIDEATGEKKTYRMDPATFPFGKIGLDGSLLAIAEEAGVEINHSCGGVCACSTCHVYVQKGAQSCSPASEDEEDMLDEAPALTPESRLSCQCVPNGSADVEVVIPKWNRNQVKEGDH
jgi:ferredoxin, 2Fe-2S